MTIYVDELIDYGTATRKRGLKWSVWCHMTADSIQELHAMADRLRLRRSWYQGPPKHRIPHYDLVPSKRADAIAHGAVEMSSKRQIIERVGPYRDRRPAVRLSEEGQPTNGTDHPSP